VLPCIAVCLYHVCVCVHVCVVDQVATDSLFGCASRSAALSLASTGTPVYLYRFNHVISFGSTFWGPNETYCWTKVALSLTPSLTLLLPALTRTLRWSISASVVGLSRLRTPVCLRYSKRNGEAGLPAVTRVTRV
jgi:hypothetical protein